MKEGALQVLLVEDERSLRERLARYLHDVHGYQVDAVADAAEAWRLVTEASRPYDVALIDDLLTPEPDAKPEPMGIELMEQVRKRCSETQCIVFTGWGMDRALEALQAGAYRYLAKPLNLDELSMTIRVAAEQARLRRERDLLSATLEISNVMIGGLDVTQTLEVIAGAVPRLVGADACAVAWEDPVTGIVQYEPKILIGDVTVQWDRHLKDISLTRQISETGEMFALADVDACANELDENLRWAGVKSFVGMPILGGPQNHGVLYAYSTRREVFGAYEQRVLKLLANQAAIALENARLLDDEARRRREADTLRKTALAMTATLEPPHRVFELILIELQKVVPYDSASVQLLKGDRLEIIGGQGFPNLPEIVGLSFSVYDDNPNREVLQRRGSFIVVDAQAEYPDFGREPHAQADIHGWLGVPMLIGGRLIGMIALDKRQPGFYTEEHSRLARAFATQAAVAIENARLLDEANHRARNLATLQNLALTVNSSLDLDATLKAACQAAAEFFSADHSGLVLFDSDHSQGRVKAEYPALGAPNTIIPVRGVPAEEQLIETRQPLVIHEVATHESLGPVRDILLRFDIQSLLIVPVVGKNGELLGSFSLDAVGRRREFTAEEVEFCRVFAAHVAVAVDNARLFTQLSEADKWREALIENAFDAVIAIDQNKRTTVFNQRAEEMFGWTAREMIGRSVARLHKDVGKGREIFEVVNRRKTVTDWNVDLKHRDGACIPALLSATQIQDRDGNLIGQAGFMRDLRQVRILEERLRSLIQVSQAITGTLALDNVLDLVVESTVAAFPIAQSATIHLYDEMTDILRVRATTQGYSTEALEALSLRVGEGITGWVFQNQRPLVVDDTRKDPRYKRIDHPEVQVHRSMICVPLCVRGQVIGTLSLSNRDATNAFQPEDLGLLSSFADQAAIAIDNARRVEGLEQMRQTAEKLVRVTGVQEVLRKIVRSAREILEADSAVIWSYDDIRHTFLPDELVAEGIEPELMGKFRGDESHPGGMADIVMEQDYLAVTNVHDPEYTFLSSAARGLRGEIGVQAFQGIALKVGDERLGVLYVNYSRARTFDEDAEAALSMFASQAALALKDARLLEHVRNVRDAAKVVAEVSVLEDLEQTLRSIVEGTRDVLSCDAVSLYTYDQATDKLGYPPTMTGVWYPERVAFLPEVPRGSIIFKMLRRDESYIVDNTSTDPLFMNLRFAKDERVESCVAMPLKVGHRRVGVMFVNHRSGHHFTGEELTNIELFAHQAAVAIRNAQLYDETKRRASSLEALYEAGKAVTGTLALDEILDRIVEQAWSFTGYRGERAHFSHLALKEENRLKFEAAYPPEHLTGLQSRVGCIDLEADESIGITGRAAKTGQAQLVGDVTQDSDYIVYDAMVRSELAVPIKLGEQVIGVINVEHPDYNAFDEDDRRDMESLAAQAAIAIENARHFEYLKKIKGYIGSKTAVDWIRMASTAWGHSVRREVGTALGHVALLHGLLAKGESTQEVKEELGRLENVIKRIREIPIRAPLSYEDAVGSVQINDLVRTHLKRQWKHIRYKPVRLCFDLQEDLDSIATVRVGPEWLRRAIEILVDNSVQAILEADSPKKRLTVTTRLVGEMVEISVRDTGPGIPKDVLEKIFREPVDKPVGSRGAGIGLILAQTIVQTYGGDIRMEPPSGRGTNMVIVLPVEN